MSFLCTLTHNDCLEIAKKIDSTLNPTIFISDDLVSIVDKDKDRYLHIYIYDKLNCDESEFDENERKKNEPSLLYVPSYDAKANYVKSI